MWIYTGRLLKNSLGNLSLKRFQVFLPSIADATNPFRSKANKNIYYLDDKVTAKDQQNIENGVQLGDGAVTTHNKYRCDRVVDTSRRR